MTRATFTGSMKLGGTTKTRALPNMLPFSSWPSKLPYQSPFRLISSFRDAPHHSPFVIRPKYAGNSQASDGRRIIFMMQGSITANSSCHQVLIRLEFAAVIRWLILVWNLAKWVLTMPWWNKFKRLYIVDFYSGRRYAFHWYDASHSWADLNGECMSQFCSFTLDPLRNKFVEILRFMLHLTGFRLGLCQLGWSRCVYQFFVA